MTITDRTWKCNVDAAQNLDDAVTSLPTQFLDQSDFAGILLSGEPEGSLIILGDVNVQIEARIVEGTACDRFCAQKFFERRTLRVPQFLEDHFWKYDWMTVMPEPPRLANLRRVRLAELDQPLQSLKS